MAGVSKRRRPRDGPSKQAVAALAQAQFMIGIYAEIVAMDQTIIERVRQLVAGQTEEADREASMSNLRLVLVQLEKVGERIEFWNARVRELVLHELQ